MDTNQIIIIIFQIAILIMSVVIHEVAHGWAAHKLGDSTAKDHGRLTLNPIPHLDPIGSLLVPILLLIVSGGQFAFGWAKPVPFNLYNLKNQKRDPALIALAGPVSNFSAALFFGLVFKFFGPFLLVDPKTELVLVIFEAIIIINIILAIFNLIPIPPLDGSKILFAFLPPAMEHVQHTLERYGFIILFAILILDSHIPILRFLIFGTYSGFMRLLGIRM